MLAPRGIEKECHCPRLTAFVPPQYRNDPRRDFGRLK